MPASLPASLRSRLRLSLLLPLVASAVLTACVHLGPDGRQYHAFELGVDREAGRVQHLRWRYGFQDTGDGEKPLAVGSSSPFLLHRDLMTVPEVFEASWQAADGRWRWACLPVRSLLHRGVEGHSLLFWVTVDGVRGEYVTYTPRGDERQTFTAVTALATDAATAVRLRGTCTAATAREAARTAP